jgi:hypothetical protein
MCPVPCGTPCIVHPPYGSAYAQSIPSRTVAPPPVHARVRGSYPASVRAHRRVVRERRLRSERARVPSRTDRLCTRARTHVRCTSAQAQHIEHTFDPRAAVRDQERCHGLGGPLRARLSRWSVGGPPLVGSGGPPYQRWESSRPVTVVGDGRGRHGRHTVDHTAGKVRRSSYSSTVRTASSREFGMVGVDVTGSLMRGIRYGDGRGNYSGGLGERRGQSRGIGSQRPPPPAWRKGYTLSSTLSSLKSFTRSGSENDFHS